MDKTFFYKYQNTFFIFSEQLSSYQNTEKLICIFRSKEEAKDFQKIKEKCNATAVYSSNPDTIEFWTSKKINFIINPFDTNNKGFDKNTFSILVQNKIYPVILLEKIIIQNRELQIKLFKHLFELNALCKKYKHPLIILCEDKYTIKAIYHILGYNDTQIQNFLELFEELIE